MFLALSLFIIFVARRGTPNLPVSYWRSQLLQDDSPVHRSRLYKSAQEDWGRKPKCSTKVLSAVHLNVHSSVFSSYIRLGYDEKSQ